MLYKRWLLTVYWEDIPKTTYMFDSLFKALQAAALVKKSHPDICINLIGKELTNEQCQAVLSTGQLPT